MRFGRFFTLLCLAAVFCSCMFSQGLNTPASKSDWEEVNFEFNSDVLVDGFPSLLRLAELLQQNPGHKVRVEGHADYIGGNRYNERLGQRRADVVKSFLSKYGAGANQVTTATQGERDPKVQVRNKDGRFMNRRVVMTVTDSQGRVVGEGGPNEAIGALEKLMALTQKCCDEILKRLDKLDEIAAMLNKMTGENDALKKELADLRKAQSELDNYVKGMQKPLTSQETANIVDTRTAEQIERARMPRFGLLGLNAGLDSNRQLTFSGRGRFFAPFKEQFAVQIQGEYMHFRQRQEGQIDLGLVDRFLPRAQAGLFASFKHVNFREYQSGGTLGQASATMDYLFSRGKVGVFGSLGFLNNATVNTRAISQFLTEETYLRTVDQVGASTTLGISGPVYFEGNLGWLRSRANGSKAGGMGRFVFPFSERFAFTLEGGMNETMVGEGNNGRIMAGLQFGNFQRPQDYLEGINGIQHAVPVDIPRVRYELLTRRVRSGNGAPTADAGPDQIGVMAGSITLDGSGSFDPEGETLTYQWSQLAGPGVSLSGMNTARVTFTAAEGQSYGFRLLVRDPQGAQGIARVSVTTSSQGAVQIVRFQASPDRITTGQQSTLDWQVLNADSVSITALGNVDGSGSRAVSPTQTTQYRLTARNRNNEVSATTTIVVEAQPRAQFVNCTVSPMNIMSGESATITWATLNADSVNISGIGSVDPSGNRVVNPTQTTTYTLTAASGAGPTTCNVTVQVTSGQAPRVVRFVAAPTSIQSGQAATLTWQVENATQVSISPAVGTVQASGSSEVRPTQNTTYTITATNASGQQVTATAAVTVTGGPAPGPVSLTACTAAPATSPSPGSPVRLNYTVANAQTLTIQPGVGSAPLTGPVTVNPQSSTTYTLTATGANNTTATCSIPVTVTGTQPPVAIIVGPSMVETLQTLLTLDATPSVNPESAVGPLTYTWEALSTGSAILDQGQVRTRVQLGGLFGDYVFRLTVRTPSGQSGSTTVTVRYRGTNTN